MKERGGKIRAFWEREENREGAFQGGGFQESEREKN